MAIKSTMPKNEIMYAAYGPNGIYPITLSRTYAGAVEQLNHHVDKPQRKIFHIMKVEIAPIYEFQ